MKSFSTTSLVEEIEKEDRIRELENMVETQKSIIEKQFQKIMVLEESTANMTVSNDLTSNSGLSNEQTENANCVPEDVENEKVFTEEEHHDSSIIENMKEL